MAKKQHIVAIGGGHGLGRLLSALSDFGEYATGIVATTDNGGSTGRIRECQGGIAWGDTRNCINQLITDPSISSMMFEYRFKGVGELNGHNLGNLMLTALNNLSVRPLDAINVIRDMLQVKTNIIPMSEHPSDLGALTTELLKISGEKNIDEMDDIPLHLYLDPKVPATKEAVDAINRADIILLGPGSFLTSIMPPLLLQEINEAIATNKQAKLVFIDNLSKEFGPAGKMNHATMLEWCKKACSGREIDIILTDKSLPELADKFDCRQRDLASPSRHWRHDREKLRHAIIELMN